MIVGIGLHQPDASLYGINRRTTGLEYIHCCFDAYKTILASNNDHIFQHFIVPISTFFLSPGLTARSEQAFTVAFL
jgi:hypothetical protein